MNVCTTFFWGYVISLVASNYLTGERAERLGIAARISLAAVLLASGALAALWAIPAPWTLPGFIAGAVAGVPAMRGPGLARLTAALGRARLAIFLLSVATTVALLYLFVPITTFLTSPGELGIQLDYLVDNNVRAAMMFVYVGVAFYALAITERLRTALTLAALCLALLTIVYAYVLPFGYPKMSGLVFEQVPIGIGAQVGRGLLDVAILCIVVLGMRAVLLRFGSRPMLVTLVLVNVTLCGVIGVSIQRERFGGSGGAQAEALRERPLRFSKTAPNVLVVFLDRFMGSYVEDILHSDPQLSTRMSGFTWYARSVSAGQNSIAGVHPMLGGYDYTPVSMNARHRPLRDLSVEAFSILPYNFSRHGFDVNMVSPRGLGFTMNGDCAFLRMERVTCTHIPKSISRQAAESMGFPLQDLAKSNYSDLLGLLAAMRSTPYMVKELLLARGGWRPFLDHSAGTTFREWAELRAMATLTDADAKESNFNFVSNILAHEPYYIGKDCQPIRERITATREELQAGGYSSLYAMQHSIAARCALLLVADYLDFLKTSGVYDNTRIVIVSDHGIVGPVEDHSTRAIAGGTQASDFVRTRSVLLVKPRDAQGPLQVSEQFMPNAEVPRLVCEEIGGCVNPYLDNQPIAALGRDDPFQVSIVPWQFNMQNEDSFVIEEQYSLSGKDPFDARGWKKQPAP